jgi:ubiquinone/menaquinone biosynthesis C-methylase UbiE
MYHRYRPSYPEALLQWLAQTTGVVPPAKVADVGCGTGISTRLFARQGYQVTGIEPNAEMLAFAKQEGGAEYLQGEAAHTGLPDHGMDMAIAAQAFHWFDVPTVLVEFKRILRPQVWCAAFWNKRAHTPFLDGYQELLNKHRQHRETIPSVEETIQNIKASQGVGNVHEAEFLHHQLMDREGVLGRAHSASYVVHDIAQREKFDKALGELFEKHQKEGKVEFAHRCVVICWQLRV